MRTYQRILLQGARLVRWPLSYLSNNCFVKREKPVHLLFCMVDHYEPGVNSPGAAVEHARVQRLVTEYPRLAQKYHDSGGSWPKRTWFFPPHYHRNGNLKALVGLCEGGYGEIELHLHHGKTVPDTSVNLKVTIERVIEEYGQFGVFGIEDGKRRYAFIHGDWALDNSREGKYCGVNNELAILAETGCYADFTFPCGNEATPRLMNTIYYATDDAERPKSYNTGVVVRSPGRASGHLMLIQGPTHPFFIRKSILGLRMVGDQIDGSLPPSQKRIDMWVKTGIHVRGKSNWIIIKTHIHGAESEEVVLGKAMHDMFNYLQTTYNDRKAYMLHYVTARELYNIIKAAEANEPGDDPEGYRNYKISPPTYDSSCNCTEASSILRDRVFKTYIE